MLAGVAWSHPSSCSKADCDGPKGQKDNMIDAGIIYFTLKPLKADKIYMHTRQRIIDPYSSSARARELKP